MMICQDIAVRTDDHSGTDTLHRSLWLLLRKPVPEEVAKPGIVHERKLLRLSRSLRRPDGHDGR
jgi:hypothetical protein